MLRRTITVAVMMLGLFALCAGVASAKDEVLLQDMVNLEKTYIPALFLTSQPDKLPAAQKAMIIYRAEWNRFKTAYVDYKPDYANWGIYFDEIECAIIDAEAVVASVTPENPGSLTHAHEALEAVRETMLSLRPQNGFSKFITDKLTVYHGPMEHIVLSLKTQPMSAELIADVEASYPLAVKAWSEVEKCPVDPGMWGFSPEQMLEYYGHLSNERAALENLAAALESGNPDAIKAAGVMALKLPFVGTFMFFADMTPFVQPAP